MFKEAIKIDYNVNKELKSREEDQRKKKEYRRELWASFRGWVVCRILQHSKRHSSTQNAQIVPDMIPSQRGDRGVALVIR